MGKRMIGEIKRELSSIDEAIELEYQGDRTDLKHYTYLWKRRGVLRRALKRLERIEERFGDGA